MQGKGQGDPRDSAVQIPEAARAEKKKESSKKCEWIQHLSSNCDSVRYALLSRSLEHARVPTLLGLEVPRYKTDPDPDFSSSESRNQHMIS